MTYLIDTNIISEIRKGERCNTGVAAWYAGIADADLFLSTLVLGEIRKGIELARARDRDKASALERWLRAIEIAFAGRVLGIDNAVADQWGRMTAIRPIPVIDGLLAATALANGLTLVTRNERDVAGLGASVFNPFSAEADHR
ncbi:type II toxin-antitoxin system VapC family toxin [Methyloraptor flagellatus]|uniref:Ribonuclease VapC n=1 Tax=Methyloraptor flagellatus TaxID=3162530 RepID=A0AAU7XED3_9HYPH